MVADGPPCQGTCTGRGHLEAVASGNAADRAAIALWGEGATAELLVDRAEAGDEAAIEALTQIGRLLGAAIGTFTNIFSPELVVVGGGFGLAASRFLFPPALEVARREALEPARAGLRIVAAELGSDAGLVGAGLLALEALVVPLAVCATPIGNLEDVTLRVLRELAEAELVLCEDTRRTRALLDRHGVVATLLSYHRHNEAKRTQELVPRLEAGARIALVSDAGLPGVNDPGARLIAAALEAGVPVTVLPGASAVETALVASGLAGERFQFLGYLPRGEQALAAVWAELAAWPHPAVAFESPQRLPATLRSLAAALPDRPVAVCRELTKRFEEVARGTAAEVAARFGEPPKGEITLVVGAGAGVERRDTDEEDALAAVVELVQAGLPRRRAADVVARLTRISRNTLYEKSLKTR